MVEQSKVNLPKTAVPSLWSLLLYFYSETIRPWATEIKPDKHKRHAVDNEMPNKQSAEDSGHWKRDCVLSRLLSPTW